MSEITVDGSRSYFDTRLDDHPHFYWEELRRTRGRAQRLEIARLPKAPDGVEEVARVDVVIRLTGLISGSVRTTDQVR